MLISGVGGRWWVGGVGGRSGVMMVGGRSSGIVFVVIVDGKFGGMVVIR